MALNKKSLKSASSKSVAPAAETVTETSQAPEFMLKSDFEQLKTVLQTLVNTLTSLTGRVEKLEADNADLSKRVEELSDQLDAALSDSDEDEEDSDEDEEESEEEETDDGDDEDVTADDLDVDKVLNIIKGMSGDEQKKVWLSARKRSGVSNLNPQVLKRKPECVLQLAEALNEEFDVDAEDMLKD